MGMFVIDYIEATNGNHYVEKEKMLFQEIKSQKIFDM